ncbi:alpha/beta hydrolase [Pseudomonadales bacterium]|nr:alpha/beta hydrolase [Pseudomonadales bacterium]
MTIANESTTTIESAYRIDSSEPGCQVYLRNKRRGDLTKTYDAARTVLFVHGATYASTLTFDYEIEGASWMDQLAQEGFDTWCIDLLGYGSSDRPKAMNEPAEDYPPICDTRVAADDVSRAIAFIRHQRNIPQLNLIGYSWGTAIAGTYAGEHPESIRKLVLYGALWVTAGATSGLVPATLGSYRTVDAQAASTRWVQGLSQAEIDSIAPLSRIKHWCATAINSDPRAGETEPPVLRAPTGVIKDFMHYSASAEPWYAPQKILAPTLIVVGEWDRETTPEQCQTVFSQLDNVPLKRLSIIGGGTHSLLLENHRHELHVVVSDFLKE